MNVADMRLHCEILCGLSLVAWAIAGVIDSQMTSGLASEPGERLSEGQNRFGRDQQAKLRHKRAEGQAVQQEVQGGVVVEEVKPGLETDTDDPESVFHTIDELKAMKPGAGVQWRDHMPIAGNAKSSELKRRKRRGTSKDMVGFAGAMDASQKKDASKVNFKADVALDRSPHGGSQEIKKLHKKKLIAKRSLEAHGLKKMEQRARRSSKFQKSDDEDSGLSGAKRATSLKRLVGSRSNKATPIQEMHSAENTKLTNMRFLSRNIRSGHAPIHREDSNTLPLERNRRRTRDDDNEEDKDDEDDDDDNDNEEDDDGDRRKRQARKDSKTNHSENNRTLARSKRPRSNDAQKASTRAGLRQLLADVESISVDDESTFDAMSSPNLDNSPNQVPEIFDHQRLNPIKRRKRQSGNADDSVDENLVTEQRQGASKRLTIRGTRFQPRVVAGEPISIPASSDLNAVPQQGSRFKRSRSRSDDDDEEDDEDEEDDDDDGDSKRRKRGIEIPFKSLSNKNKEQTLKGASETDLTHKSKAQNDTPSPQRILANITKTLNNTTSSQRIPFNRTDINANHGLERFITILNRFKLPNDLTGSVEKSWQSVSNVTLGDIGKIVQQLMRLKRHAGDFKDDPRNEGIADGENSRTEDTVPMTKRSSANIGVDQPVPGNVSTTEVNVQDDLNVKTLLNAVKDSKLPSKVEDGIEKTLKLLTNMTLKEIGSLVQDYMQKFRLKRSSANEDSLGQNAPGGSPQNLSNEEESVWRQIHRPAGVQAKVDASLSEAINETDFDNFRQIFRQHLKVKREANQINANDTHKEGDKITSRNQIGADLGALAGTSNTANKTNELPSGNKNTLKDFGEILQLLELVGMFAKTEDLKDGMDTTLKSLSNVTLGDVFKFLKSARQEIRLKRESEDEDDYDNREDDNEENDEIQETYEDDNRQEERSEELVDQEQAEPTSQAGADEDDSGQERGERGLSGRSHKLSEIQSSPPLITDPPKDIRAELVSLQEEEDKEMAISPTLSPRKKILDSSLRELTAKLDKIEDDLKKKEAIQRATMAKRSISASKVGNSGKNDKLGIPDLNNLTPDKNADTSDDLTKNVNNGMYLSSTKEFDTEDNESNTQIEKEYAASGDYETIRVGKLPEWMLKMNEIIAGINGDIKHMEEIGGVKTYALRDTKTGSDIESRNNKPNNVLKDLRAKRDNPQRMNTIRNKSPPKTEGNDVSHTSMKSHPVDQKLAQAVKMTITKTSSRKAANFTESGREQMRTAKLSKVSNPKRILSHSKNNVASLVRSRLQRLQSLKLGQLQNDKNRSKPAIGLKKTTVFLGPLHTILVHSHGSSAPELLPLEKKNYIDRLSNSKLETDYKNVNLETENPQKFASVKSGLLHRGLANGGRIKVNNKHISKHFEGGASRLGNVDLAGTRAVPTDNVDVIEAFIVLGHIKPDEGSTQDAPKDSITLPLVDRGGYDGTFEISRPGQGGRRQMLTRMRVKEPSRKISKKLKQKKFKVVKTNDQNTDDAERKYFLKTQPMGSLWRSKQGPLRHNENVDTHENYQPKSNTISQLLTQLIEGSLNSFRSKQPLHRNNPNFKIHYKQNVKEKEGDRFQSSPFLKSILTREKGRSSRQQKGVDYLADGHKIDLPHLSFKSYANLISDLLKFPLDSETNRRLRRVAKADLPVRKDPETPREKELKKQIAYLLKIFPENMAEKKSDENLEREDTKEIQSSDLAATIIRIDDEDNEPFLNTEDAGDLFAQIHRVKRRSPKEFVDKNHIEEHFKKSNSLTDSLTRTKKYVSPYKKAHPENDLEVRNLLMDSSLAEQDTSSSFDSRASYFNALPYLIAKDNGVAQSVEDFMGLQSGNEVFLRDSQEPISKTFVLPDIGLVNLTSPLLFSETDIRKLKSDNEDAQRNDEEIEELDVKHYDIMLRGQNDEGDNDYEDDEETSSSVSEDDSNKERIKDENVREKRSTKMEKTSRLDDVVNDDDDNDDDGVPFDDNDNDAEDVNKKDETDLYKLKGSNDEAIKDDEILNYENLMKVKAKVGDMAEEKAAGVDTPVFDGNYPIFQNNSQQVSERKLEQTDYLDDEENQEPDDLVEEEVDKERDEWQIVDTAEDGYIEVDDNGKRVEPKEEVAFVELESKTRMPAVYAWGDWSECSASCGIGQRFRSNRCADGQPCLGKAASNEVEVCSNKDC
ncbi:protein PFC0760c [Biomphalaria glabrata]|nr:protein PFC0760c [Biomphalaria glabrata]